MTGRVTLRERLAALAVATVAGTAVLAGGARPAGAVPILDPADATELAQALAEATEDQDVCYGWEVTVTDYGGSASGTDEGSSLGVGSTAIETQCPRWVIFEADITYTSASSESEDFAFFSVRSNVPGGPSSLDLRKAGITEGGLLGGADDQVVANAALLLPAVMAEKGLAPPIVLEGNTQALPSGDRATGTPTSDWLRKYGAALGVAALTLFGALAWAVWIWFRERPFAAAPVLTMRRKGSGGLPE